MPMSTKIGHYPVEFFDFCKLREQDLPTRLEFPSEREARAFRMRLYGFGSALQKAQHPGALQFTKLLFGIANNNLTIQWRDGSATHAMATISQLVAGREETAEQQQEETTQPRGAKMEKWMEEWLGKANTESPNTTTSEQAPEVSTTTATPEEKPQ